MNPHRELRRQLLLARCELDRRELGAEIHATRDRMHDRFRQIGRAAPWVLLGVPIIGLLVGRRFRIRPMAAAATLARWAVELRVLVPLITAFMRGLKRSSIQRPFRGYDL
jgi:hypothetical protein